MEEDSCCYDFIEWVGADMSVMIFMFLDDPTDLVRASAVSSSWRNFGIRRALLMLEILSRRFFLKLNLSDHRSILTDLQKTSKGNGGRYEHANPVSLKAQDGGDHMTMNRDYAWLMISRHSISSLTNVKDQANVQKSII
uniref:F-box domain-containing protein n=1 Tax=Tanacetum cinerariifolium TaxID=118510 RepID=A0A699IV30_TANCI|nr:hypothetical protein [Tanacetum cinerariifolium]